jgi:hypothetical protein
MNLIVSETAAFTALPKANRPAPSKRKFNSTIIEEVIVNVKSRLSDPLLGVMFE